MRKHILDPPNFLLILCPPLLTPNTTEHVVSIREFGCLCFNMASDFIGYTILVTLKDNPSAQIQGVVSNVIDTNLMLEDGQSSPRVVWRR